MAPQSSARMSAMVEDKDYAGIAADSRDVRAGFLFAAIPGTKADGGRFVADAIARGASAVLGLPSLRGAVEAQGVRFISSDNPRLALAREAAAFYRAQPRTVAAVTGTNGKTSVAVFLRQIWAALGHQAASLGTIGAVTPRAEIPLAHTTPDPVQLHRLLAEMAADGVDHLALEASSHGLDQYRLDGVEIAAAAFTNLTRDHLDYHPSIEAYLEAKLRLFELAREVAVVNAEAEYAERFIAVAKRRGLRLITVATKAAPHGDGQMLDVDGRRINLPLAGRFQASNALVAAALAVGLGDDADKVYAALEHLEGAPGRLERVARQVYVDYAHTPDALETVLKAMRPHTAGRLIVVFGCGGDRDKGKRPLMGEAACRLADKVIVTDDNPRSEVPAEIRREILVGCPNATEIGDRAEAIRAGIQSLKKGDVLVIAGKGHESGQTIGAETRPFSDRDEARRWA